MRMRINKRFVATIVLCGCALLGARPVSAQTATASGQTTATTTNLSYTKPSSVRIGLQARYNAINVIMKDNPSFGVGGASYTLPVDASPQLVPLVTPGVRILNERLFLGLGFGFWGRASGKDITNSRAAFSMNPTALYDIISEPIAALSVGGWLNLADVSGNKSCSASNCSKANDGTFGWGVNLAAGIRGKISRGLAIGGEFGWGFLKTSGDSTDDFGHGVFGNILLEASVGI